MEVRIAWKVATLVAVCCLATELSLVISVMADSGKSELNNCRPPSIRTQGYQTQYFIPTTQYSIACMATGDGKITYRWLKDGKPLDLSSESSKQRMTTKPGTGSLVFYKAHSKDEGVYQCVVENNCGTSLSVKTRFLEATMAPFPMVEKPTTIKRVLGSSAVLSCNPPKSVPKATVFWILTESTDGALTFDEDKDDRKKGVGFNMVTLDRRVTMDYNGNLYITSIQKRDEQDGKQYVCMAQNELTRSSNRGEDKVIVTKGNEVAEMGVDLMWSSKADNLVLEGKRAKFKCIFSGQPEPKIIWTRVTGGKMDTTRMIADHHELVIRDVKFEDAGQYRCAGQNSLKPEPKTHTFTLKVEAAPQWRETPRNVEAGEDESASFDCDAVGNPKPTVEWYINGKIYSKSSSKGMLSGNTMVFNKLEKEDSQVIQCNASNIYGYIWADIYLFVQALPPKILVKPQQELIVAKDTSVTLTCEVTGKPKPTVVWYKGSQPLNHQRFKIQENGDLLIKETTMRDKGEYICKAENRYGRASASGMLTVRDKTKIITEPVSEKVDYTNQVTFTCGATTDDAEMKNLRYRWLKNGAPLNDTDKRFDVNGGVITIFDTKSKDTGSYTCVAENGLDNDTATATLKVKAPPDPPYNVEVEECLAKEATIKWKFDNKMRNFDTMVRYVVEYQTNYEPKTWAKGANVDYPEKKASVKLSPYAVYMFRVRAVNKMGVGDPSVVAPTKCQTMMAVPYESPSNVRTDEQYTGFLVIRWKAMKLIEHNGPNFEYNVTIQDMDLNRITSYNISDYKQDEFRLPVNNTYRPYLISVRARNQVGTSIYPPSKVRGYSGESVPTVIPKNFEVDPSVNVTATMAGFQWDPVDTSPEAIQGKFQGYKIRFWKKGEKDTSMHEEIIPSKDGSSRRRRAVEKVRGRVMNLPSFSEIIADVVVINTNFESEGSNKVNITTPEGVPGPVQFLEALYRGSNHFKVYWQKPPQPNGVITGYRLSYKKIEHLDFGDLVVVSDSISPTDERWTISELESDAQYRIYIRAKTKIGWGEDYFIDVVTASELMDLAPPKIQEVLALDNEANVSWTLDMADKGSRIGFTYYLQYKKEDEGKWSTSKDPIENRFWANLDHLDPGTTYEVRVIAVDAKNDKKEPSGTHLFRTSGAGAARASFLTAAWFIGMMIAIAILILILIIVCVVKRNRGDNYPVQEKERLRGNCDDNHDHFNGFGKGSDENGIGVSSSFDRDGEKVPLDVDADSMDYGDDDASRFNEDGSFIGQYGPGDKSNDVANVSASSIV